MPILNVVDFSTKEIHQMIRHYYEVEVFFKELVQFEQMQESYVLCSARRDPSEKRIAYGYQQAQYDNTKTVRFGIYTYVFVVDRMSTARNLAKRLTSLKDLKHSMGFLSWEIRVFRKDAKHWTRELVTV
jgi:uncharacterized protein YktA (UPF0223 family)